MCILCKTDNKTRRHSNNKRYSPPGTKKTKASARIPRDLHRDVVSWAEENDTTLTQVVIRSLRMFLRQTDMTHLDKPSVFETSVMLPTDLHAEATEWAAQHDQSLTHVIVRSLQLFVLTT